MSTTQPIIAPTTGMAPAVPKRFGFTLAIVALVLMSIGASAPSPFYPVLAQQIGFDAIALTTAFAVYPVALLLSLLTAGSLSDHVGRRPVAIAGFLLLAGSMLLFSQVDSVALLVLARIIQGVAGGLLLSTLSASVLDFARPDRPMTATLWNALAPAIGLAIGALLSGVALDVAGEPLLDIFGPLTALYVVLAVLFLFTPETSAREPGAWASLQFRLSIPARIRADFWRGVPAIIAGWATAGLFLSLGATIVRDQFDSAGHLWQGLPVTILAGVGALAAFALRRRPPRTMSIVGTAALALGTALSLVALGMGSLPAYLVAAAVTGIGFGTAFTGVLSSLAPHIPATQRADTFAVIFLLSYLAFGIPAVLAGALEGIVGLGAVCVGYGVIVIALSVLALVFRVRRAE